MNPSQGDSKYLSTNKYGWWSQDDTISAQMTEQTKQTQQTHGSPITPLGFTQEYRILAEVAANMSSGFMLLNKQEYITYTNPHALRLLHISKNDLNTEGEFDLRRHLLTLATDPSHAQPQLDQMWFQQEQESSVDLALTDAAVSWLRVRSFPIRDAGGTLLGRGVLLDDITLERSALEMRSEALSQAAHQLKTPLAIIKGCATTLLGGSARWDPAMQREMLQMIDLQSDRLYDVLNTLLDVWRLDAGAQHLRLTQVQFPELLNVLVERWRKQAPHYTFHVMMTTPLPLITCDAMRVEQAVNHLLSNAVTYSPQGKRIQIVVEANDVELRVSITDEGIGIAPEHFDRIFDRFYRVNNELPLDGRPDGSGLGLAAARALIEAHGGKIWVDSPGIGCGATFYFTLPFTGGAINLAPTGSGVRAITQSLAFKQDRRVRVLLAENDPRLTRYLRANLEEQRYRVQTVNHGVQFLRQLDLEEPDVIILATRLADMSGIELLQRLRDFSQIPVIMLCDDCDEDERVQLFDLGSDDLVMKPFGMKELLARIRALLRRQVAPVEQVGNQSLFITGDLTIDYAQRLVTVEGRAVQLSRTEYKLLSVLAQNVGMVVTHELLLEKVWGPEYNRDIDFIWVYISRVRRKIDADSRHPKYILTVPNVGYKLAKL